MVRNRLLVDLRVLFCQQVARIMGAGRRALWLSHDRPVVLALPDTVWGLRDLGGPDFNHRVEFRSGAELWPAGLPAETGEFAH